MSGGTNDHPCTPTFLQLYKILSAFSILKPLKLGNCTPLSSGAPKSIIAISILKELYKTKKASAFEEIKKNLKFIVEDENSDFNDFINMNEHDYALPDILDCLLFYKGFSNRDITSLSTPLVTLYGYSSVLFSTERTNCDAWGFDVFTLAIIEGAHIAWPMHES